ncbi:MAG: radical SAM protein [Archaeoglobaceae archaeon]|nr:radical SAM protein [Archaeoglobaceae archaeon]
MISFSKLISGTATVSKKLTYEGDDSFIPEKLKEFSSKLIPIIVWNISSRCNLKCLHCYARTKVRKREISTEECERIIDNLAKFRIPLILFSGGEPLLREDIFEIVEYAKRKKIKVALSTNGTLINRDIAEQLKIFEYVGISLDGIRVHDEIRGVAGAFESALKGLKIANEVVLTGVRFTLTKYNFLELPDLIKMIRGLEIPRFCLYHLVPSGSASFKDDVDNVSRRRAINYLIEEAEKDEMEILTVDNPADGIYLYLRTKNDEILEFLKYRGGDASGIRLACIDSEGYLHPNQFWMDYTAGNLLKDDFADLWLKDPLFKMLREKEKYLQDKCGDCKFKKLCGGFRVRAYRKGNLWGWDPSCYIPTSLLHS